LINTQYFTALILIILRISGFAILVPVFFPKGTPNTVKVAFALILGYILIPGITITGVSTISSTPMLILECINETVTGITLGYITNLCFTAARVAGNMMDLQIGFAMMSMFDPNSNSNTTMVEQLLYWLSMILFLMVDGHHMLITALIESFNSVSLGKFILMQDSIMLIIKAFTDFFSIGLKIAIPIVLIIILTDLTMGLVARAVPSLNVMILGLPVKILVGMASLVLSLGIIIKLIEGSFHEIPAIFKSLYKTVPLLIIFAADDKTEDATPHKMSEARKKGQVAKSKDVSLAFTLLTSTLVLTLMGEYAFNSFKANLINFIGNGLNTTLSYSNLQNITLTVIIRLTIVILPFVMPILIIGVLANFLQTGFIYTKEPLKPDLKKLNPISGFKRIFSIRTVVQLVKDLLIVIVVSYIGYTYIRDNYQAILNIGNLKFDALAAYFGKLTTGVFFKVTIVMIAIALADFLFQRFQFKKDMRMSKQEVKEEFKQEEGDPVVKNKRRQKQRELAMRRMMQQVPKATVVVTNPTHIAVALMYAEGKNGAPIVVAKGADYVAIKIKEKAKESNIPVIENKPLARLIYEQVEIDSEIPADMYQAVAEILALVFKIKKRK
jgi:flagellar biosynthesis protein FliR/FlhB